MNYSTILERISEKSGLKRAQVKNIVDLFIEEALSSIDSEVSVRTSKARIIARHRKSKTLEENGSTRSVPERFYGIIERTAAGDNE